MSEDKKVSDKDVKDWIDEMLRRYDMIEQKLEAQSDMDKIPIVDEDGDIEEIRRDRERYDIIRKELYKRATTPLHYFIEGEEGITSGQESYIKDLLDGPEPLEYIENYLKDSDDIKFHGTVKETIGSLTKDQASEVIDKLKKFHNGGVEAYR